MVIDRKIPKIYSGSNGTMIRPIIRFITLRKSFITSLSFSAELPRTAQPKPSTNASTSEDVTVISGSIANVKNGFGAMPDIVSGAAVVSPISDGKVSSAVK